MVDFSFLFLDSCSMRSQSGNLMRIQGCLRPSPVMNDTRFRTEFCGPVDAQPVPQLAGVSLKCVTRHLHFFFCFLPITYDLLSSSGERLEFEHSRGIPTKTTPKWITRASSEEARPISSRPGGSLCRVFLPSLTLALTSSSCISKYVFYSSRRSSPLTINRDPR